MGYKFLKLEEVKESGRWTDSGVEAPKTYNGHKRCAHCDTKFIVNQLKPGREPIYCSQKCCLAAYRKRHEINEKHPLREPPGLKGGTDERYLAQIKDIKAQVDELKEMQKAQIEGLKEEQKKQAQRLSEAQKVVNNTILKKIAALTPQKTTNITAKEVATDIATSATGALIAEKVRDFFTKWENKPVTKGELEHLEKQVHHWFGEVQENFRMEVQTVLNTIKEKQKKALFH